MSPPEEICGCLITAGGVSQVVLVLQELKCTFQAWPEKHQVFQNSQTSFSVRYSFSYLSPQRGGKSKDCFVLYASGTSGAQRGPRTGPGGVRQLTIQSGSFLLFVEFYLKVDEKGACTISE